MRSAVLLVLLLAACSSPSAESNTDTLVTAPRAGCAAVLEAARAHTAMRADHVRNFHAPASSALPFLDVIAHKMREAEPEDADLRAYVDASVNSVHLVQRAIRDGGDVIGETWVLRTNVVGAQILCSPA